MQELCGVLPARIESKIDRVGSGDCWTWVGAVSSTGYGTACFDGGQFLAHRLVYKLLVGPVPEGLDLDHVCRVRRCVNPRHLEPVTRRENLMRSPHTMASRNARKTHCKYGHEYTPENTGRQKAGRYCRECKRQREAARRA